MEKKLAESIKMAEMQRKIQREKLDMVRKNNELNLERQRKVNWIYKILETKNKKRFVKNYIILLI